jgi:hypothetical protein
MVSFYIASPLITFNLLSAFAIDVYCKLEEYVEAESKGVTSEVYQNIQDIQEDLSNKGFCLHVAMSAALKRAQVYKDMFPQEGGEDDPVSPKDDPVSPKSPVRRQFSRIKRLPEQEEANLAMVHSSSRASKDSATKGRKVKDTVPDSLDGHWRTGSRERVHIFKSRARFSKESWALRVRGSDGITATAAEGENYEATLVNGELHWDDGDVWVRDNQAKDSDDEGGDGRRVCTNDCVLM